MPQDRTIQIKLEAFKSNLLSKRSNFRISLPLGHCQSWGTWIPSKVLSFSRSELIVALLFPFLLIAHASYGNACKRWFELGKIDTGKSDCLPRCMTLPVDMSTFDCRNSCDELCKSSTKESWLFQLSDLYPGLTPEERALAAQFPQKMLKAYQLSWKAEELCLRIYESMQTNDASDACRHFVWAALLNKEFGPEFSSQVLNGHEQDLKQPQQEKSMDLANNRLGQLTSDQLIKDKQFSESTLLEKFKENLERGRIIVLRSLPRATKGEIK